MKDKAEIINTIIKHKSYNSYLELGVGLNLDTIPQINCKNISSVDVLKVSEKFPSFVGTTDEFFINNINKFDVIYIDADHEETSVLKDFNNSIKCLNEDGVIFMHDVGPEREIDTALSASGTAYKVFISIRASNNYTAFSYKFENGDVIGIVKKRTNENKINTPSEINYEFYNQNKDTILQLKNIEQILELV